MQHITWYIKCCVVAMLFVLAPLLLVPSVTARPMSTAPDLALIERYLEDEMRAQHIPGMALGIVQGDQTIYLKGFGIADPSGRAITPQTPFPIGKVSKSFTALAVMQLVEAGKVELDTPVQHYLPSFRVADETASAQITVRHLLTQTSGLSHAAGLEQYAEADLRDSALEQHVRDLSTTQLAHPVGTVFEDTSANAWVLGMLIQTIAGQSYADYIQQQIFAPLAMHQSFTAPADAQLHGLATGYHYWFGQPVATEQPFDRGYLPGSGLIASVEDMTHFLAAQLNEGRYTNNRVLSPVGIAELHHPAVVAPGPHAECLSQASDCAYAMGWGIRQINGVPAVIKSSDLPLFAADVVLIPSERVGIVILMNADTLLDPGRNHAIVDGVTSLVLTGQAPVPSSSRSWIVYLVLLAIVIIQLVGMVWSLVRLRRWRTQPERRPYGRWQMMWQIVCPLLVNLGWGLLVLGGITTLSLPDLLLGAPDLASILLASSMVALIWGIVRTVVVFRMLRKPIASNPIPTLAKVSS